MKTPIQMHGIKAVVFDVFGTLVEIGEKRRPFFKLMQMLHAAGRAQAVDDSATIMSNNVDLAGTARMFGVDIPASLIMTLEQELHQELATIFLYPEVIQTLNTLRAEGLKIGLCSNLAAPYAAPVKKLLPFELDVYAWSFEIGSVKPDARIYRAVCSALDCDPQEIVMVGDTLDADYLGPKAFGMHAFYLTRNASIPTDGHLKNIQEILPKLGLAVDHL